MYTLTHMGQVQWCKAIHHPINHIQHQQVSLGGDFEEEEEECERIMSNSAISSIICARNILSSATYNYKWCHADPGSSKCPHGHVYEELDRESRCDGFKVK